MAVDPKANLGVMLFVAYRQLEERAYAAVLAAGAADLTMAQARLMSRIDAGGSRITDLATQARVTKQTASFLVDALEQAGYVERVPDPSDGRARLVRLAVKGLALVPIGQHAVETAIGEWTEVVGDDRLREITRTLAAITDA